MFDRGVSFTPAAAPAGRACENWPVANTRFPTMSESHTTPLICTVGSGAAVTVSSDGSVGAVSAAAGVARKVAATTPRFAPISSAATKHAATLNPRAHATPDLLVTLLPPARARPGRLTLRPNPPCCLRPSPKRECRDATPRVLRQPG